jgi:uncharacterized protein (DUF58 family)
LQLGIFLNLDTFEHYWEGLDVELTERGIVAAASIAVWASRQRYAVGVYANGLVAGSDQPLRLPPGRGSAQLPRIMEGLAKLTPYSTLPVARTLRAEAPRFPWGSTLVVVTPLLPEALTAVLVEMLGAGHRVVLVPLGDCPAPPLRGLVVRRVDETAVGAVLAAGRAGRRRVDDVGDGTRPVSFGASAMDDRAGSGDGETDTGSARLGLERRGAEAGRDQSRADNDLTARVARGGDGS